MGSRTEPQEALAEKVLPKPLYQALTHIFQQGIEECGLVGGSALSGFYFAHRRSDDLDLFSRSEQVQNAAIRAAKSLENIGVNFLDEFRTHQYYRATCKLNNHSFTIDIVLDPHIHSIGKFIKLNSGIIVASLETILMTKISTLVSRCSEKDLYDLLFLFNIYPTLTIENMINLGQQIDGGLTGETLLLSLSGISLRKSACDFSLSSKITPAHIFRELTQFQQELILSIRTHLKNQPVPELGEVVKKIKSFLKD